jgi:3-hydroxyacyl-CoA dehydrogenase / enoyl-CoA hydratase / 3-hydroxybutyryl-CoA epimerase
MISYSEKGKTGVIQFNDPNSKVNLLSVRNLISLERIIDGIIERDEAIEALFFISKKDDVFIAGADIKELASIRTSEEALEFCKRGQYLFNKIEGLNMPTFAVVNGACIGGGLELALACGYILVIRNKKIILGLPEVKLGIVPGFGGTYRLAAKIGRKNADELIRAGKLIDAAEARKKGLADLIIPEQEIFFYKKHIKKISRGRTPAALRTDKKRAALNRRERDIFSRKIFKEPAVNAMSGFLLSSRYKNYRRQKPADNIKRCAVMGAGTMGRGITYLLSAEKGLNVSLYDVNKTALGNAGKNIKGIYDNAVKRNLLNRTAAERGFGGISFGGTRINKADILIECVTEDMALKKDFFRIIERQLPGESILASNTSCLSINGLAESLSDPRRFLGTHFFNPAYKMKLVEVVPSRLTSKSVIAKTVMFLRRLRRVPVLVKDSPGFLVNRMLLPYLNESVFMLEEGYLSEDMEFAMVEYGMPMGPFRLLKEIGLDVAYRAGKTLEDSYNGRIRVPDMSGKLLKRALLLKRKEKKCYGGPKSRVKIFNYIVERLLSPMRREAELCLKEGIVNKREAVDLALFLGIGFPWTKRIWKK